LPFSLFVDRLFEMSVGEGERERTVQVKMRDSLDSTASAVHCLGMGWVVVEDRRDKKCWVGRVGRLKSATKFSTGGEISCAAWIKEPDTRLLFFLKDRRILVADLRGGSPLYELEGPEVMHMAKIEDDKNILTIGISGRVYRWRGDKIVREGVADMVKAGLGNWRMGADIVDGPLDGVSIEWAAELQILCVGTREGKINIWSGTMKKLELEHSLVGHRGAVDHLHYIPGDSLYSAGGGKVCAWNPWVPSPLLVIDVQDLGGSIHSLSFPTKHSTLLAALSSSNILAVYDTQTRGRIYSRKYPKSTPCQLLEEMPVLCQVGEKLTLWEYSAFDNVQTFSIKGSEWSERWEQLVLVGEGKIFIIDGSNWSLLRERSISSLTDISGVVIWGGQKFILVYGSQAGSKIM